MINITSKMVIKHWSSILLPNVIFRYGVKSARFVQGTDVYSYITSFPWNTPNTTLEKDLHYQIRVVVGVQSLSHVWLFLTRWTAVYQAFLSFTISLSLLKLMSIDSVIPSNHLIFCCPFLLLPSIFTSIRIKIYKALQISIANKTKQKPKHSQIAQFKNGQRTEFLQEDIETYIWKDAQHH